MDQKLLNRLEAAFRKLAGEGCSVKVLFCGDGTLRFSAVVPGDPVPEEFQSIDLFAHIMGDLKRAASNAGCPITIGYQPAREGSSL